VSAREQVVDGLARALEGLDFGEAEAAVVALDEAYGAAVRVRNSMR
jgi:FKBP-type peptidyl-prolyl cis-trans isomerase 2